MAKEFLLVDGYNIIHAWSELRELVEDVSLESARQRLMDILSNYKGTKQATVILVFDGYLVKGNIGTVYEYNNIFVVYTKEAETADHYIERVVTSMPKHYKVRVATGDSGAADYLWAGGDSYDGERAMERGYCRRNGAA